MKLTRGEFKNIVKECLIEILSEGINSDKVKRHSLASDVSPKLNKQTQQQTRQNAIQPVPVITGNAVLDEVLMDTAKTTLPLMQEAEGRKQPLPMGNFEKVVSENEPRNLFGDETTSKWAALAFNEIGKKS